MLLSVYNDSSSDIAIFGYYKRSIDYDGIVKVGELRIDKDTNFTYYSYLSMKHEKY